MKRASNIELLRIIAMLMILVIHANFFSNPLTAAECSNMPLFAFFRCLLGGFSIACVDTFVFISGYFGINATPRKFCQLLFQVLFYLLLIFVLSVIFGFGGGISLKNFAGLALFTSNYWFVKSYLLLFLLSPALNMFAENVSQKTFRMFLIVFLLIQFLYGWLDSFADFRDGFSAVSFIGIYMLARYLRMYVDGKLPSGKSLYAGIYALLAVVLAVACFFVYKTGASPRIKGLVLSYLNPLVIIETVALFFWFKNMSFDSNFINRLSLSAFAVYLIHCNPNVIDYYSGFCRSLMSCHDALYFAEVAVLSIAVYLACSLVDQSRIWCWEKVISLFDKVK